MKTAICFQRFHLTHTLTQLRLLFFCTQFDEATPLGGTAVQGPIKTQFGHHLIQVYERAQKS